VADPVLIKPAFQSAFTDSGDTTRLGPNAWNDSRLITGGNAGDVVVCDPSSVSGASWSPRGLVRLATMIDTTSMPQTPVGIYYDLWTYTLPPNTLGTDGDILKVFVSGAFDGNVQNRQVTVVVGSMSLGSMSLNGTAQAAGDPWFHQSIIMRYNSGSFAKASGVNSGGNGTPFSYNYSNDFTGPVTIAVQGQQSAAPSSWPTIWVRQVLVTLEPI